jgi:predicted PurR-regulated permease PerM
MGDRKPNMPTETDVPARILQRPVRWIILLGAAALIVYLCARIIAPFINVIAWSLVLAVSFYPLHERLVRRTRRPSLSALVSSLLVVVTILIPVAFVAALAINELLALRGYLGQASSGALDLRVFAPLREAADWLLRRAGIDPARLVETLSQHASQLGQLAAAYGLAFATNLTGAVVSFVFVIFTIFFLFRDGAWMAARIPDFLPFDRARSERVLVRVRDVIYASVYGVLVIAAIQGVLMGLAFSLLGIPSAALWGVVTVLTSIIPLLGAGAVWAPGAIYLMLTGHWVKGVLLVAWGAAVVSSVDNFLRPKLVGGRVGLSELVMFFSVLGGLQVFGLLGIIVGPVIFAIAGSLLEALSEETAGAGRP